MWSRWNTYLRRGVVLLVAGGVALGFVVSALRAGWMNDSVRAYAERALSRALGTPVVLGKLEGNILSCFELTGIRVGTEPILQIESMRVRYRPLALLRKAVVVDSLAVRAFRVIYREDASASALDSTGQTLFSPDPDWWHSGPKWRVQVASMEVDDGRLSLYLPDFQDKVKDIYVALGVRAGPDGYELALRRFRSAVFDPPLLISNLTAAAMLRKGRLSLEGLDLSTPGSRLRVYGIVSGFSRPDYDLTLFSDSLAFKDVARLFPGRYPAGKIRLVGHIQGNLREMAGDLEIGYRSLVGHTAAKLDFSGDRPSYDIRVEARGADLSGLGLDAHFDLVARLQGRGVAPLEARGRLTAELGRANFFGSRVDTAGLVAQFNAGRVRVDLTAAGEAGRVKGEMEADLKARVPAYGLTAYLAHLDLSRMPFGLEDATDITGMIRLARVASGGWRGRAALDSVRVGKVRLTDLGLDGAFQEGRVVLDSLKAGLPDGYGTLRGRGRADLGRLWLPGSGAPGCELTVKVEGIEPERLTGISGLGGPVSVEAVLSGEGDNLDSLRARADVVLDAPDLLGAGVDSAGARLRLEGRRLAVERVRFASPLAALEGGGWARLGDSLDVRLNGQVLAPGRVGEALGVGVSGDLVALSARLSGTWERPGGVVILRSDSLNYRGIPMAGVRLQTRWPVLSRLGFLFRAQSVEWAGRVLQGVFLDASLEGKNVAFLFGNSGETKERVYLWGTAGASGGGYSLSLDSLFVQVEDITLSNRGPCRLTYHPERGLQVERFILGGPGGWIEAYDHPDSVEATGIHLKDVDLRHWAFLMGYRDELSGVLNGEVVLSGTLGNPLLSAEISLRDGSFSRVPFQGLAGELNYGENRAIVDLELEQMSGHVAVVRGAFPLDISSSEGTAPDGSLRLRAKSEALDVGFLSGLFPGLKDISGTLAFDVNVEGTASEPKVTGRVSLRNGRGRIAALHQTFQHIQGDLRFEPGRVLVDSLHITSRRGKLGVTGQIGLDGYRVGDLDLRLKASEFEALNRPELNTTLAADLHLTGNLENPHIEGRADLNRAVLRLSDFIEAPPDPESIWKTWPFFVNMVANVQVSAARNVWIRDQDLNVEIEGDVDLRKNREDLRLYGVLSSRQGWYAFLNRNFKIDKGEIQFQGRPEMNPDIYILGETRQRLITGETATFQVIVGGTLLHPQISLESDTGLTEEDILSYLAFGRPSSGWGDTGPTLEGQAKGLVLGLAANRLKQSIGKQLNLDVVEIDMGEAGNVTRVRVGKYIGSRLFVTYAQDISGPGTEVTVEYELLPWLTLEAEQRPQEEGKPDRQRLGFIWKVVW